MGHAVQHVYNKKEKRPVSTFSELLRRHCLRTIPRIICQCCNNFNVKLDSKDVEILRILQKNCRLSAKEIAEKIKSPISTVYAKIRRMEKLKVILGYRAILNAKELGRGTTAFILASVAYRVPGSKEPLSQVEIAEKIALFPEVQEVHIISGNWDLLIKVKAKDVDEVGEFVVNKLRKVEGIEKTLTCMVFKTAKETTEIPIFRERGA